MRLFVGLDFCMKFAQSRASVGCNVDWSITTNERMQCSKCIIQSKNGRYGNIRNSPPPQSGVTRKEQGVYRIMSECVN